MLAGLQTLLGLIARRDRIKLPLTVLLFVGAYVAMVPLLQSVYGDSASIQVLYQSLGTNPAMLFMTGPIDEPSFGALVTIETLLWWGLAIAFINTLFVVRHTRHNEEIGAEELLRSGQTHRATGLLAALLGAVAVNGIIAVGLGFGMQVAGATWGVEQAWLLGLAIGAVGLAWAGVAAVVAQLVESGRAANGLLAALIGAAFVVRGIGDFLGSVGASGFHEPAWISYLSPFGWLQATRPLVEPSWWLLAIPFVFFLATTGVALLLQSRRDVGEGLLPSRAGRVRASRFLVTPLGLTMKLQKNIFIGWLAGVLVMLVTIGALVPQMGETVGASESMRLMIEQIGGAGELLGSFMAAMISITCLLVFAYVIHALSKLRSEEASGHLESLLGTKLSRLKWIGLHLTVVVVGGLILLALVGPVLALMTNVLSDSTLDVWRYTLAGLSYAPIMLLFAALYTVLFGFIPRLASGVCWLYFGLVTFALWIGPMLQLNQAVMNLSIMEHISTPPLEDIAWRALAVITASSIVAAGVGIAAFGRRNLQGK